MTFPPIDVPEFVDRLLQTVPRFALDYLSETPNEEVTCWTKAVKHVLHKMGDDHGLESIYTQRELGIKEFLLDFVWWNKGSGQGAVLGCECEFGNTRYEKGNPGLVADDFDKLLSFKAPLKVMIFDSSGQNARIKTTKADVVSELNRYLQAYGQHLAGETYLLIDFANPPEVWRCDVKTSGHDSDLSFKQEKQ